MATTSEATGCPTKLGAYANRAIVAQRIDGTVQLRDEPANGDGRSYLIEPNVGAMTELQALVADYKATAERIDDVPMKRTWF